MCGKSGKTSKIAAFIVILFNIVTLIFCILIFSISLWIIVSPKTLSSIIQSLGNSTIKMMMPLESLTLQLGIVGAFISAFFFFISAMGFYGAISGSQFLLFMYATLVILLLLLECAVMFYVSSNAVEKGLEEHSVISHSIRISLECCDVNDTKPQQQLVWSCCNATAYENCTREVAYTMDCQQKLIKWLSKYETVIYVTLAVVHIILSSCSILRRSFSASHSHS